MTELKGLAGASGCVDAVAVVLSAQKLDLERRPVADGEAEVAVLEAARGRYRQSLAALRAEAGEESETGKIFFAYGEILDDPVFFAGVAKLIREELVCASFAVEQKRAETEALFAGMDDAYLKERANDINNVCNELMAELQGIVKGDPFARAEGERLVVFAEDLTPADTVRLDKRRLAGMVTEKGGVTSHTVILAKALGIPAVVGLRGALGQVATGDGVLVDGADGRVVLRPDDATRAEFVHRVRRDEELKALHRACRCEPATTRDGLAIRVNVNAGDKESVEDFAASCAGCDGVGLFRTEFLYMDHDDYPDEEAQYAVYAKMAEQLEGRELIIRTLDIGGDKQLGYMDMPQEMNPFLGYRAIRLCLDRTEMFKTQLRAILRAGAKGDVKVMFPMIVTLEELLRAKELLAEAAAELAAKGVEHNPNIPVGVMIETPAAALLSDQLAKHVSFFSIGSNDLIQYTTATDRMNEKVSYLYQPCNISVLRFIKMVCENAKREGVQVGICGEVASEVELIPLWAALGVDELSVAPALVGQTKYTLGRFSAAEARRQLEGLLDTGLIDEVKTTLARLSATE
ncbi:phosphoenolpyruvate--protein phosphotransferase [Ruminococcaceae bacterium OttesenSCG-928-D13]|nr:phosphoenolpyruvate--protein phosphotransferase [Ruminococcaceae bacterium OttesenSCG-928-D13]